MTEPALLLPAGRTLGVIGAGVMGRTLIQGLLDAGLVSRRLIWAAANTQASCDDAAETLGITAVRDYGELAAEAAIILVCVKPAQIATVAGVLRESALRPDTLLISILAGVSTERLQSLLNLPNPWLRAMPNTPCVVREGMTVVCGSGPAYMYLVLEALADAGVKVGLRRDLALQLVAQTMLGSARMVLETHRHPASLRDDVTTPAGCTIGGLLMLEDGKIRSVLARAVEEATRIVEHLGRTAKS